METFILYALIAGIAVTLVTGPLGAFVVWRRMAYFGDAIAHSALLGVVLGLACNFSITLGIVATALTVGLLLILMQRESRFSSDTLLGILAHAGLSLGLVALALLPQVRVDISVYLFGDILAVTLQDIYIILAATAVSLLLLCVFWRKLLLMTIHEDLARVEGVEITQAKLVLMLVMALMVAVSIKVIGILLITSLLIIPAATARYFARIPTHMAIMASIIGALSVVAGLIASLKWDTPSGPSIVVAALVLFVAANISFKLRARNAA